MVGRVLVTGSSGFVGGALGVWLRRAGWTVMGVSRSPPRPGACDEFTACDLAAGPPDVAGRIDAVVHCAALASPWARPADYRASNVKALGHVLDLARAKRLGRFVLISSSAVHYAYADQLGLREDTPWPSQPANLYAASKRRGEAMVRDSGLPWTILRPRAVFGPGDTVVFPRILRAARRGALPTLVRPDGRSALTDLLYIDNLCGWIEQALRRDVGGAYLLANGEPVEVQALLHDVLDRLGAPPPGRRMRVGTAMTLARCMEWGSAALAGWREPPVTRFGVASLAFSKTVDIAKARAELGAPVVSLREGLDRFVAWQAGQGGA
jgi:2-alkyl-3-oxoalkanoate reductase